MADRLTNTSINRLEPRAARYEVSDAAVKGLRVRVAPTGEKTYYLIYSVEGKKRRYRIGRHGDLTIAGARKLATAKRGEIAAGKDVQAERQEARVLAEKDRVATLGAFLDELYIPHVHAQHKRADKTEGLINYEFGHLRRERLDQITPLVLNKWRQSRLTDGVSPGYLNCARGALSGVLSRPVEWGHLAEHPYAKNQFRRLTEDKRGVVRFLDADEETRLRRALRDRDESVSYPPEYDVRHVGDFTYVLIPVSAEPPQLTACDAEDPQVIIDHERALSAWRTKQQTMLNNENQRTLDRLYQDHQKELRTANPVAKRWKRMEEKKCRAVAAVAHVIEMGEFDHMDIASIMHGQPEGQGLSLLQLQKALREHLKSISRPDLIRGMNPTR